MSNHAENPEQMRSLIEKFQQEAGEPIGATKRFPEGKLTNDDEGELRFAVSTQANKIIVEFGKPVAWLGLTKELALQLSDILKQRASELA